jgi:hypothetical protein
MSHEQTPAAETVAPPELSAGDRLELYKVTVEMADRISARRGLANSFFVTLNTALVAALAVLDRGATHTQDKIGRIVVHSETMQPVDAFYVGIVAAAGLVLAATWWLLLRSYRDLNNAKFKVIHRLEEAWGVKPFAEEWEHAKAEKRPFWKGGYAELGNVERAVPAAFALIYLGVLVKVIA